MSNKDENPSSSQRRSTFRTHRKEEVAAWMWWRSRSRCGTVAEAGGRSHSTLYPGTRWLPRGQTGPARSPAGRGTEPKDSPSRPSWRWPLPQRRGTWSGRALGTPSSSLWRRGSSGGDETLACWLFRVTSLFSPTHVCRLADESASLFTASVDSVMHRRGGKRNGWRVTAE